jgi:hypothetical protein
MNVMTKPGQGGGVGPLGQSNKKKKIPKEVGEISIICQAMKKLPEEVGEISII